MHVGIIGAGFTGSILSAYLLKMARSPLEISLIDGSSDFGRGAAYGTDNPDHLLNVRVSNMSALVDDPHHFLKWLWARDNGRDGASPIPPSGHAFVSRKIYGDYVRTVFEDAVQATSGSTVRVINQAVTAVHNGKCPTIVLSDKRLLYFDRLVLCVGNFPPATPPGFSTEALSSKRYLSDPWAWKRLRSIPLQDDVVIFGSGLTMADAVQSLLGNGHEGVIQVVSRHGLTPRRHEETRTYAVDIPQVGLTKLVRFVRQEIRRAAAKGYGWRDVMDALRPSVSSIWQALTLREKRQFLRHLRPYWDVHRHRLAPRIADAITRLQQTGQLRVAAGRIRSVSLNGDRFNIDVTWRGGGTASRLSSSWVINCSGPHSDYRNIPDAFVQNLLDDGIVRADRLSLGIDVTPANNIVAADGTVSSRILAIGPPTKGIFWECTAVPDIRAACARVATALTYEAE